MLICDMNNYSAGYQLKNVGLCFQKRHSYISQESFFLNTLYDLSRVYGMFLPPICKIFLGWPMDKITRYCLKQENHKKNQEPVATTT